MDVNSSDELENTSLMFAAYNNHAECCKTLLEWGADLTLTNCDQLSAYEIAVRRNNVATVNVIRQYIIQL